MHLIALLSPRYFHWAADSSVQRYDRNRVCDVGPGSNSTEIKFCIRRTFSKKHLPVGFELGLRLVKVSTPVTSDAHQIPQMNGVLGPRRAQLSIEHTLASSGTRLNELRDIKLHTCHKPNCKLERLYHIITLLLLYVLYVI